jgi:Family of unknown function (DUF5678)
MFRLGMVALTSYHGCTDHHNHPFSSRDDPDQQAKGSRCKRSIWNGGVGREEEEHDQLTALVGSQYFWQGKCNYTIHVQNKTVKTDLRKLTKALQPYENRWVALVGNKVVAARESVKEVKQKAEQAGYTDFMFHLVPSSSVLLAP